MERAVLRQQETPPARYHVDDPTRDLRESGHGKAREYKRGGPVHARSLGTAECNCGEVHGEVTRECSYFGKPGSAPLVLLRSSAPVMAAWRKRPV